MRSARANANFAITIKVHTVIHYNCGNFFLISSGEFRIGGWVGMERKSCGNGWGWKSDAAGTDGDGNHI